MNWTFELIQELKKIWQSFLTITVTLLINKPWARAVVSQAYRSNTHTRSWQLWSRLKVVSIYCYWHWPQLQGGKSEFCTSHILKTTTNTKANLKTNWLRKHSRTFSYRSCSSSSEEKSPMVFNPDPKQYLKQLKEWHVIVFYDQSGETLRAAPTLTPFQSNLQWVVLHVNLNFTLCLVLCMNGF